MNILIVVKKFGLCGGMEEYVYRLAHELVKKNLHVSILCERSTTADNDQRLTLIELGEGVKKPRWLSHIVFAYKVRKWITDQKHTEFIIHSHERINCHHITTIHSTLFNFPKGKLCFPSFRKWMNEYLEKREVSNAKVKMIVPVSNVISYQISKKYPQLITKITKPVHPGVKPLNVEKKKYDPGQLIIGFMGTEWKRKGLPKVINIWRTIREKIPTAQLCLAGFSIDEKIGLLQDEMKFVQILGYIKEKEDFFGKIDILLHPAKKEAFGMVIAEALSLGIPVVCSKECGITTTFYSEECSLNESATTDQWVTKTFQALERINPSSASMCFKFNWENCADSYLNLYKKI